jgi:hypothetical protein
MSNARANIPDATALLCERCGYVLNGLAQSANCPECGQPALQSLPILRHAPAWEQPGVFAAAAFLATTWQVLFHPARFYRTLAMQPSRRRSSTFAATHWAIISLLIALAAYIHFWWIMDLSGGASFAQHIRPGVAFGLLWILTYAFLHAVTRVAARLTSWEAAYRGLRLPLQTVTRGLDYHAAHYLPVAVGALATVFGYYLLLHFRRLDAVSAPTYLYVLCGEVVLAAIYLFKTYWIGMRNLMYANG